MQLQTNVKLHKSPFQISHKDKLTFVGSCFADNMGQRFSDRKFKTTANPFGVLYNPLSVNQCLTTLLDGYFDESQLIEHEGVWHSLSHHSSFSNTDKTQCLKAINENITKTRAHLIDSDYLFLTFGTALVYEQNDSIVSNCHKLPSKAFTRRRLSIDEIANQINTTISSLQQINPKINIIFTVSPVRYAKDGLHENSLSKATLLLAIEKICKTKNCFYFPAYEIIMDELRDYRFFAEDMTHLNATAIDYVWEKMEEHYLDRSTTDLCKQLNKITVATKHRPFNTNPAAHAEFKNTMYKKASDLQSRHPELDLQDELHYFKNE